MRKLFLAIVIIVVIIMVTFAVLLIPAHIQTRRVTPTLPSLKNIAKLKNTSNGPVKLSYILTSSQQMARGQLGHPVFIAEWEDGKIFMIDSGMDEQATQEFANLLRKISGGGESQFFGTVTNLLGPKATQVQGVGFTHLHIDHTQGIVDFCTKRMKNQSPLINAYLTPLQKNKHNFNTKKGAKIIRASCLKENILSNSEIMHVEGFPGLGMIKLGGHTPGSTLFTLTVDGHIWILSGDTTATKAQIIHNQKKRFLYSYVLVPENTYQTAKLRPWLASLDALDFASVIVSHDLEALQTSGLDEFQRQ